MADDYESGTVLPEELKISSEIEHDLEDIENIIAAVIEENEAIEQALEKLAQFDKEAREELAEAIRNVEEGNEEHAEGRLEECEQLVENMEDLEQRIFREIQKELEESKALQETEEVRELLMTEIKALRREIG